MVGCCGPFFTDSTITAAQQRAEADACPPKDPRPHSLARATVNLEILMKELKKLFSNTWNALGDDISDLEDIGFPGVYFLAYTDENLNGEKIRLDQIFYIGMSNSRGGIEQRIYQFLNAIEGRGGHSAGNRFFVEYCGKESYSKVKQKKRFYFSYLAVPCEVRKTHRQGNDLRKMGEVARFEYCAIAHVKDSTGKEPDLNKK